jgi:hypothetical protein
MHCPEHRGIRQKEKRNYPIGNLQWYCSGNKEEGKISSSAIPTVTFKAPSLLIKLLTSLFDTSFCLGYDENMSKSNHIKQEKSKQ